jgi:hypothetical protein
MTLVCWAAILVATVAGATFAITKFSVSSHIAALQTRLESAEKQRGQDQHVIDSLKSETHTPPSELGAFLPNVTMESASKDKDLAKLAERIAALEKERIQLVTELAKNSQNALDPKSELVALVSGLSSGSRDERIAALKGLFELADPRSFNSLVAYFLKNTEEATGSSVSIYDWHGLLLCLDRQTAAEFLVKQLEATNDHHAGAAFRDLMDQISDLKTIKHTLPFLESVALRSENPLARTRAKLVIEDFKDRLDKPDKLRDTRSLWEVIRDTESIVKGIAEQLSKAEQPAAGDSGKAAGGHAGTPEQ